MVRFFFDSLHIQCSIFFKIVIWQHLYSEAEAIWYLFLDKGEKMLHFSLLFPCVYPIKLIESFLSLCNTHSTISGWHTLTKRCKQLLIDFSVVLDMRDINKFRAQFIYSFMFCFYIWLQLLLHGICLTFCFWQTTIIRYEAFSEIANIFTQSMKNVWMSQSICLNANALM